MPFEKNTNDKVIKILFHAHNLLVQQWTPAVDCDMLMMIHCFVPPYNRILLNWDDK